MRKATIPAPDRRAEFFAWVNRTRARIERDRATQTTPITNTAGNGVRQAPAQRPA